MMLGQHFLRSQNIILVLIIFFAFVLRFYNLTNFPVGLNADEASFGYDAYSILKTGKDQWGQFLPLTFKSFGEYKTPLYVYLDVIPVSLFGLNIFSTRLPGALFGTLAVYLIYLLSSHLYSRKLGLITAFLLAVSPWGIMISRGAFESGLINFFIPASIYLFIKGLSRSKYFIFSAIFFGLGLFTYHSAKLLIPLLICGLIIIFKNKLLKINPKYFVLPIFILLLAFVGVVYSLSVGGGNRIAERSITQGALEAGSDAKYQAIADGVDPLLAKLFHNKYQVVVSRFIGNYSQMFSSQFLFKSGVREGYYGMVPGIAVLNLFEAILLLGLVFFTNKTTLSLVLSILGWLFISPLPSALSTGAGFSGHRAIGMLVPLLILSGFGLIGWLKLLKYLKSSIVKTFVVILFSGFVVSNIFQFLSKYFNNVPLISYQQMSSGYLAVFEYLAANSNGREIFVSRSLGEPQIFIAFATRFDPILYQKATQSWDLSDENVFWVDQLSQYSLGQYTVKSINWYKDIFSNTMIIARPDDFPINQTPDKIFSYPNGTPVVYLKSY